MQDQRTGKPRLRARRLELAAGAVVFVLPLAYLATERTRDVFFFRWSKDLTLAIALYAPLYAAYLASYRWSLPAWMHGLRKAAVVLASTVLLALACAEATLAALDDAPYEALPNTGRHAPDPDVGHVYFPNFSQTLQSREHRSHWRSNAQGVRADRDFGPKPAGVARVLAHGDSFTVGDQVELEETWPGALQRALDASCGAGKIEVVNAGFPGFSTANEAQWLAKFGAGFEPDLVLVAMTPNDLLENQFPLQYVARDGAMVAGTSNEADRLRWEQRSRWWSVPGFVGRTHLARLFGNSAQLRRLSGLGSTSHREAHMVERNDKARRLFALAEGYLLEAREHALAMGAEFALIVIPYREQMGELGPGLDATVFGRHWKSFGEAQGFEVLDLLSAFRAAPTPRALYWKEDNHCNVAGYRLIGEEAARFVAAREPIASACGESSR